MHLACPALFSGSASLLDRTRQTGAAAIETTLAIMLLLFAATAVIELSYWGMIRQLCRLALHETLRIAVAEHATQHSLAQAFAASRHSVLKEPWRLRIVEPNAAVLSDFQDPVSRLKLGVPTIRNDSQREQHARFSSHWPGGIGPASGKTIFEANILKVELEYQHRPLSPWFRSWLGQPIMRLSAIAAMQSDFHASHIRQAGRPSSPSRPIRTEKYVPKHANPPTRLRQSGMKKQKDNHQADLNPERSNMHALDQLPHSPEANDKAHSSMPEDAAKLCGTLLCCPLP